MWTGVSLAGDLDTYSNPVKPSGPTCTEGLAALVLWTKGVGDFDGFVRLTTKQPDDIFCGCAAEQDKECTQFPPGAKVRIRGTLSYTTSSGTVCTQPPCYLLQPESRCFVQGCDVDAHCAGATCNKTAHRCRGLPGGDCHHLVGCDSKGGVSYICAKTGQKPTCQTGGDGSEGAVCVTDQDCTCAPCMCGPDNVCETVTSI